MFEAIKKTRQHQVIFEEAAARAPAQSLTLERIRLVR